VKLHLPRNILNCPFPHGPIARITGHEDILLIISYRLSSSSLYLPIICRNIRRKSTSVPYHNKVHVPSSTTSCTKLSNLALRNDNPSFLRLATNFSFHFYEFLIRADSATLRCFLGVIKGAQVIQYACQASLAATSPQLINPSFSRLATKLSLRILIGSPLN
jgi:hypothetical protein